jgi:cbb3-type cytochrome oxidase subunit 3
MDDWAGVYKLARLAILALVLLGIAIWLFRGKRKERLEAPARRMLEDDDE